MNMLLQENKKIYFVSDAHLGVPNHKSSLIREKLMVQWLDQIKDDAAEIFFLGDIFDFWFEYKSVVPKGFVRLLGKIAEISDSGIPVHYFTGNHDMWVFDYFEKELGVKIYRKPIEREFSGKLFFIGHGDGLGPGDLGYKFIKAAFSNKITQKLFSWLHPGVGTSMALYFSRKSRIANGPNYDTFRGEENERLIAFCKEALKSKQYHFFILGHRHLPLDITIAPDIRYINIGEWIKTYSYAVFDGKNLHINYFKSDDDFS